ncbi:MAG: tetraacyldisaccharide 4'-kinase [Candidatus Delongbacteria bacterium]|nr:tetraacyldisaccharide 4'-kinase [Candidatus Delongbacteria bacterium]
MRLKTLLFPILWPLSGLYYLFCLVRHVIMGCYPARILLNHYIISIGNLALGGTGKTPIELYLAGLFKGQVNIITRGYRRTATDPILAYGRDMIETMEAGITGDEAYFLATHSPESFFSISTDKEKSLINCSFPYSVTIIDDAFHWYRIRQNLKICVLDAEEPLEDGHLFPWGRLRHPLMDIKLADIIWLSRADRIPSDQLEYWINRLQKINPRARLIRSGYRPDYLISPAGEMKPLDEISHKKILAVSGIAKPDGFHHTLNQLCRHTLTPLSYPDHHPYKPADIQLIEDTAGLRQIDTIITTEKDMVKLKNFRFSLPILALHMRVDLL